MKVKIGAFTGVEGMCANPIVLRGYRLGCVALEQHSISRNRCAIAGDRIKLLENSKVKASVSDHTSSLKVMTCGRKMLWSNLYAHVITLRDDLSLKGALDQFRGVLNGPEACGAVFSRSRATLFLKAV
jgi:hypothetical protein